MKRRALLAACTVVILGAGVAPVLDASSPHVATTPSALASIRVVGSGQIAWKVGRREDEAVADCTGGEDARAVPSGLPSSLGDGGRRATRCSTETRSGTARAPGSPERTAGVGACCERLDPPGRPLARHLPRVTPVRVLRAGRSSCAAAASLSEHGEWRLRSGCSSSSRSSSRSAVSDSRRLRIRDLRLLEALRLARRRGGRRARHELAAAHRPGCLARLCSPRQSGHPLPARQGAAGNARQDRRRVARSRKRPRRRRA